MPLAASVLSISGADTGPLFEASVVVNPSPPFLKTVLSLTLSLIDDPTARVAAVARLADSVPRSELMGAFCDMALELALLRRQNHLPLPQSGLQDKSRSMHRPTTLQALNPPDYLAFHVVERETDHHHHHHGSSDADSACHLNDLSLADPHTTTTPGTDRGDMDRSLTTVLRRDSMGQGETPVSVTKPLPPRLLTALPPIDHTAASLTSEPARSSTSPSKRGSGGGSGGGVVRMAEFGSFAGSHSSMREAQPTTPSGQASSHRNRTAPMHLLAAASNTQMLDSFTTLSHSANVVTRGETLDSVNDLEFVRPIGHGAQATVWLCVDVTSGEERAVKVIDRSHTECGSDMAEIQAAMRLRHENVIRLYEVIDDPTARAVFLVMEYLEHGHTGSVHADTGTCDTPLAMQEIAQVIVGTAQGLQYCHARGVLHGDIKPENILLHRTDGDDTIRAILADFGVSKLCAPQEIDPDAPMATVPSDAMLSSTEQLEAFLDMLDHRVPPATSGESPRNAQGQEESTRSSRPHRDPIPALSLNLAASNFASAPKTSPRLPMQHPSTSSHGSGGAAPSGPRSLTGSLSPGPSPSLKGAIAIADLLSTSGSAGSTASAAQNRAALLQFVLDAPNNRAHSSSSQTQATSMEMAASRSLREMSCVLADRTRELNRRFSADLRAKFWAKRGVKTVGGTPAYLAPELLEGGQPTPASDMWAVGVTLYALLFKRLPWHGATWGELKNAVCNTALVFPVATICDREQRRWRAIVERLLEKDPRTRMTAAELCRASIAASRCGAGGSQSPTHASSPRGRRPEASLSSILHGSTRANNSEPTDQQSPSPSSRHP